MLTDIKKKFKHRCKTTRVGRGLGTTGQWTQRKNRRTRTRHKIRYIYFLFFRNVPTRVTGITRPKDAANNDFLATRTNKIKQRFKRGRRVGGWVTDAGSREIIAHCAHTRPRRAPADRLVCGRLPPSPPPVRHRRHGRIGPRVIVFDGRIFPPPPSHPDRYLLDPIRDDVTFNNNNNNNINIGAPSAALRVENNMLQTAAFVCK